MSRPRSSAELSRLLKALSDDVVHAHIHWRMASELGRSLAEHPLVEAQSRTFWYLTRRAHVSTALQLLCKAFDQEQSSLHLLSWLRTIEANLPLFEVEAFRERLAENAYVEILSESAQRPDPLILATDISLCVATDPLVKKLVAYRGSQSAHRSTKLALRESVVAGQSLLTDMEVEALLKRSTEILNRYTYMFAAETHSTSILGKDDYKYIFKAVEASVQKARRRDVV